MSRMRNFIIVATLAIAAVALSGCIITTDDDADVTCDRFDSYMSACYPTCYTGWDCEYNYESLDLSSEQLMDDCADCLYSQIGTCNDCVVGSSYCFDLLTSYLGISCTW